MIILCPIKNQFLFFLNDFFWKEKGMPGMKHWLKNLTIKIRKKESNLFDNFILIIIATSALIIGFETDRYLATQYKNFFYLADLIILAIFIFEIFFKWHAYTPRFYRYFLDSWNVFDFSIVVLSILPHFLQDSGLTDSMAMIRILRLARVFRIFRFISILKPLQLLVNTLMRSLPSMGYVALLVFILFYIITL